MSDWNGIERRKGEAEWLEGLIDRSAEKAVDRTMERLGLNNDDKIDDFIENQKYVTSARLGKEDTKRIVKRVCITTAVPAFLWLCWHAFKEAVTKG